MVRIVCVAVLSFCVIGCGGSSEEENGKGTTPVAKKGGAEPESEGPTADPSAIPAEKFEEIDAFFKRKAAQLQFTCYNSEVERSHKKFQGNVDITIVVAPGNKLERVKVSRSSLNSPEIEECIVAQMKTWSWPDVPALAPYQGSVGFKPAW
jgi:hypothetical protein